MHNDKVYTIRTQSNYAHSYGLGEVISDGVAFFKAGSYDLSKEELDRAITKLGRATII